MMIFCISLLAGILYCLAPIIPIFGVLYGHESVTVSFFLLSLYTIAIYGVEFIFSKEGWLSTILNALLVAFLFATPLHWTPKLVLMCYDGLVLLLEPLWMFFEVVVLHQLITMISSVIIRCYDFMEVGMKLLMLILTAFAYCLSAFVVHQSLGQIHWWLLMLLFLLTVMIHYLVYVKDEGNILDTALLLLATLLILSSMKWEAQQLNTSGKAIKTWNRKQEDLMQSSFALMLWKTVANCTEYAGAAYQVWVQFLSVTFLLSLGLRVAFLVLVHIWSSQQRDEEEDSVHSFASEDGTPRQPTLAREVLYKVLFFAMCARAVQQQFEWAEPTSSLNSWIASIFHSRDLLPGRLLQAFSLQFLYIGDLLNADDYESW